MYSILEFLDLSCDFVEILNEGNSGDETSPLLLSLVARDRFVSLGLEEREAETRTRSDATHEL